MTRKSIAIGAVVAVGAAGLTLGTAQTATAASCGYSEVRGRAIYNHCWTRGQSPQYLRIRVYRTPSSSYLRCVTPGQTDLGSASSTYWAVSLPKDLSCLT